jgi:FKBP-type peptidyl-prolyl cis-trans isomerase
MNNELHTRPWQRVVIWIIVIATALGSLGFYFLIIMQNNAQKNASADTSTAQSTTKQPEAKVDPTAYTVDAPVTELQKTDLKVGDGAEVKAGDTVTVHYKGTLAKTGAKFDSSYDRGEPLTIALSGVIQGWQEGVPGMKVGGKRRLVIPAAQGYGAQAAGSIPANSDLVFEIELLAVNPPVAPQQ